MTFTADWGSNDRSPTVKSMYGKTYFGNERTTFVVGADGAVARVLRKVKPAEHDELVLGALREIGSQVT